MKMILSSLAILAPYGRASFAISGDVKTYNIAQFSQHFMHAHTDHEEGRRKMCVHRRPKSGEKKA
jgi:hypothetical protein